MNLPNYSTNSKDSNELVGLIVLVSTFMSLIVTLIFVIVQVNDFFNYGSLELFNSIAVFAALILFSFYSLSRYDFLQQSDYKGLGTIEVKRNSIRVAIQLLLGVAISSYNSLISGELISRFFGIGRLKYYLSCFKELYKKPFINILEILNQYSDYYKYSILSSFINACSISLIIPIIMDLFGAKAVGEFSIVQRTLTIPSVLIGNVIGDIFYSKIAKANNKKALFYKYFKILLMFGLIFMIGIMLFGPWVYNLILGPQWESAGDFAQVLSISFFAMFIVSPLSRIVFITGKLRQKLVYDICYLFLLIAVYLVTKTLGLSIDTFLIVYVLAVFLSYSVYMVILNNIIKRL